MRKFITATGAAAILSLHPLLTHAADTDEQGWYVGLNVGQSKADINKGELDDLIDFAYSVAGAPILSGNSSLKDSSTSFGVTFGYNLNTYWAVEFGYVELGKTEYRFSGTVDPPGAATSAAGNASIDFESSGITLAAVVLVPIGQKFDAHARFGGYYAHTTFDVVATTTGASASGSSSANSQSVIYGLGAGFKFNEKWRITVDYTHYRDVGDADETGQVSIDNLNASIIYRF